MTADPIANLEGVAHRYGGVMALDHVSLAIPAGCMAGLIGPDGVGKSTLLGLIAGARRLQDGAMRVFGGDMRKASYRAAVSPRIAYMPQGLGGNLYATLSVAENIDFFGRLFGLGARERMHRSVELLEATGLAAFRDRPAGKLSGGMRQKLGLCCALIHAPDLLVLDEPTTGIDPLSRRRFWELIDAIRARRPGMSVIVATSYMEEAARFDWLAAMDTGHVLATGSPGALMQKTGTDSVDEAFIALLPEARRAGHTPLELESRNHAEQPLAIEARDLTRRFGQFTAVDRVSFSIPRGEIFGFLGSNGCGKTTTMKMLTGLLPPSDGEARLFGEPVDPHDLSSRQRVGYMSQSFSLYGELTVRQNLELHARLFHLPAERIPARIETLIQDYDLADAIDARAADLPLGIRQRLSLAVAVVHEPELLILDEPTSGVDPVARDQFWRLLGALSRNQGVTIFISTHFMNEGERCDRVSLMHAGEVLAVDTPRNLVLNSHAQNLEDAFIRALETVDSTEVADQVQELDSAMSATARDASNVAGTWLHPRRLFAYAYRESLELLRDPIRLTFALLGSALLMMILGYGITFDVDDLPFAVLDRDRTPESREYIANLQGSRYFQERPPLNDTIDMEHRLRSGELGLAIEIPPGFGRDIKRGDATEVGVWVDGSMPFRGETMRGYVQGMHYQYLRDLAFRGTGEKPSMLPFEIEARYRYNQDFRSLDAMVPAVIPLMLIFLPAILMALGVVREKELGSITNLYVTPVSRVEFLLGKQLPYVVVSMVSFYLLVALAVFIFDVELKGSLVALSIAALLYVSVTTGMGLLVSTFTRTQIAGLAAASIVTMIPTVQFSGLSDPVSSLEGASRLIGEAWPATHFISISRGLFTKALEPGDVMLNYLVLAAYIPVITLFSALLLRKQGR